MKKTVLIISMLFSATTFTMLPPEDMGKKECSPRGTGQDGDWPPYSMGGSDIDPNENFEDLEELEGNIKALEENIEKAIKEANRRLGYVKKLRRDEFAKSVKEKIESIKEK